MMKKSTITLITCSALLVAGVLLGGLGFLLGGGHGYYVDRAGAHLYSDTKRQSDEKNLADFDSMNINFPSGRVEFVESDHFGAYYDIGGDYSLKRLDVSGGTLYVEFDTPHFMIFNFGGWNQPENMLKVYYPKGTKFQSAEVEITSGTLIGRNLSIENAAFGMSSGEVKLSALEGKKIVLDMTSGSAQISGVKSDSFDLKASSGDVTLEEFEVSGLMSVKLTSGGAKLREIKADSMYTKFSSGNIKITGCTVGSYEGFQTSGGLTITELDSNGFRYESSSGDVRLEGTMRGENDIRVTSGGIRIENGLPEEEYSYTLKATSGDIRVNGEEATSRKDADAKNSFNIRTSSGDVKLNFAQ